MHVHIYAYIYTIAVLFGGLFMAASASAGESMMLDEITVKGKQESPLQENLTVREVRESPARDIGEALQQVEGINTVRKGAIANDVVLRGFQRDNINVLVDGVRVYGACPNRMDSPAFHYDFAEIEQIQILKGPYDLENAGTLGGMINAKTKKPHPGLGSDLNLTYGSYDSINASGTVSYGADTYDALAGYAYKYSGVPKAGNGKRITDIYPPTSPNRYRSDTIDSRAYEINTGWTKFGYNPTEHSRTEISYSYQDADHVLYPYLKMDADYDRTHILNWTYRIEKVSPVVKEAKLQAYWDRVDHLMDDRFRESSRPTATITRPYSMQTDATTQVVGAKANASLSIGPGTWKNGIDYYDRNWDATNKMAAMGYVGVAMIPDVTISNFGLFSEYEFSPAEKFTLKGGMRGDLTWAEAGRRNVVTGQQDSADFGEISADLMLTYKPVEGLEIFTGLARGSRTPDPQELFVYIPGANNRSGNPNLRNTINSEADLGIKHSTDRYYINATVFYSSLSDYINLVPGSAPNTRTYANISASMWGAELGSQVSLPSDFFLKGTLSYAEGENRTKDTPLSEIPPLKGTVAVRYDNGMYFAEVTENLAARQDRVDPALQEKATAGWCTTDLKAGVSYKSFSLFAGVNNLFDKYYFSHLSYLRDPFSSGYKVPENGRNFYVTAQYKF